MCRNEIKPQTVRLQVFISIAMYPAIRQYDEQTFDDMSEESEKNFIIKKPLWSAPSQGIAEQAKQNGK